jgi:hypothetical protein
MIAAKFFLLKLQGNNDFADFAFAKEAPSRRKQSVSPNPTQPNSGSIDF